MAEPSTFEVQGLRDRLSSTTSSAPTSSRAAAYRALLTQILAAPRSQVDAGKLKQLLHAYLDEAAFAPSNSTGGGLVVGRQVLLHFVEEIQRAASTRSTETAAAGSAQPQSHSGDAMAVDADEEDPSLPAITSLETRREVIEAAVDKVNDRATVFEDGATRLRLYLSSLLEAEEDWLAAARTLQGTNLEASNRALSDYERLEALVRIARLYLEADDSVQADVFLKRASHLIGVATELSRSEAQQPDASGAAGAAKDEQQQVKQAKVLVLSYKLCQARVNDSQRRFLEAAARFHELSYNAEIDQDDRSQMLSAAVTACILAPAGPQRSRILSALIRDERTGALPQRTLLTKVYLDQIVRPHEIAAFETLLAPHQTAAIVPTANDKAIFAMADAEASEKMDGTATTTASTSSSSNRKRHGPSTVLDRAMIEHNVLAASRLYMNITVGGLASLLDLSPLGAETIARRMIQQKRLLAEIDQTEGTITFQEDARAANSLAEGEMTSNVASAGAGRAAAAEASGTGGGGGGAGGSGDGSGAGEGNEEEVDPDAIHTKRWDAHIARTAGKLEDAYQRLLKAGLVQPAGITSNA